MQNTQLTQELKEIKKDLKFIKENMVDKDMILTEDDFESLLETAREKNRGKLISLKKIEKELGFV